MEEVNETRALQTIEEARQMEIIRPEQYTKAGEFLKVIKNFKKEIKESFDPIIEKTHQAHKEAVARRDKKLKPFVEAENLLGVKMVSFQTEQQRKAQIEQERLRKLAEAEARELERRAEKVKSEEKREELLQRAEETKNMTPVVKVEVPKIDKIATRTVWKFEVIDEKLVPREYLKIDEVKIGSVARATKGTLQIPGIRIYSEESIGGSR